MLVAVSVGWFLSFGFRMVFPALLPQLRSYFGFDLSIAGLLLSVLWFAYALGQLPGGLLADRVENGRVMAVSTLLSTLTLSLVIIATSTTILFVATALFSFGAAFFSVVRFTSLAKIYPERVGTAIGISTAAGDLGNTVLPPTSVFIAVIFSWHWGFGYAIPLFALISVFIWRTVRVPTEPQEPLILRELIGRIQEFFNELRGPSIYYGTGILVVGSSIMIAFTGFFPTYLVEIKHQSATNASLLFGLFFGLSVFISPISGFAYDRFGLRYSVTSVVGIAGLSIMALPFVEGIGPLIAITVGASFMVGYPSIAQAYVTEALPTHIRGRGLGFLRLCYLLIGSASPTIVGYFANQGYFDMAIFGLGLLTGLMIILAVLSPE